MRKEQREQSEGEVKIDRLIKQFRLDRCHLHSGIPDHKDGEEVLQGILFLSWCLEISHSLALYDSLNVQQDKATQPDSCQSNIGLSNADSWAYLNAEKGRIEDCNKEE